MAGASFAHNRIVMDLGAELRDRLRTGRPTRSTAEARGRALASVSSATAVQ